MIYAFEGIDGAGKATCIELVSAQLNRKKLDHVVLSFPQYGKSASASVITKLLNGCLNQANPYFSAAAFAMDRFEAMRQLSSSGSIILCDRFVASNAAFQAARVKEPLRTEIIERIFDFEHVRLGIPKPDLNLLLDVPVHIASRLISKKNKRSYTDDTFDAYEADREYQGEVASVYKHLALGDQASNWVSISVNDGEIIRHPREIAQEAFQCIVAKL